MAQYDDQALEKLLNVFLEDPSGSHRIKIADLSKAMRAEGIDRTEEQLQTALTKIDGNTDGEINFFEFLNLVKKNKPQTSKQPIWQEANNKPAASTAATKPATEKPAATKPSKTGQSGSGPVEPCPVVTCPVGKKPAKSGQSATDACASEQSVAEASKSERSVAEASKSERSVTQPTTAVEPASGQSPALREKVQELFDAFDPEGHGSVPLTVVGSLFKALGRDYTLSELQRIGSLVDKSKDGSVDFSEFLRLITGEAMQSMNWSSFCLAFEKGDKDFDNELTREEFVTMARSFSSKLSAHALGKLFNLFDEDDSGRVSWEEFDMAPL